LCGFGQFYKFPADILAMCLYQTALQQMRVFAKRVVVQSVEFDVWVLCLMRQINVRVFEKIQNVKAAAGNGAWCRLWGIEG